MCVNDCGPANAADEALGVVRASKGGDHLSCDEAVAAVTASAVQTLVVCSTDVLALLLEEAGSRQITVTHCGETWGKENYAGTVFTQRHKCYSDFISFCSCLFSEHIWLSHMSTTEVSQFQTVVSQTL